MDTPSVKRPDRIVSSFIAFHAERPDQIRRVMTRFYSTRFRRALIAVVCLSLAALGVSRWSGGRWVVMGSPAPGITATKAAVIQTDVDGDGRADPGDTI